MKLYKILGINLIVTGGILLIPEILLSQYFLISPAYNVPEALINYEKNFEVSSIENSKNPIKAIYSRDSNGYRPHRKGGKKTILTIGGSTTDQRFIDNNKTWQAVMEKNSDLSVINGGVDGQSSFGHLQAIKKWHSKALKQNKIDGVLFYIGVNDVRLIGDISSKSIYKSFDSNIKNIYDNPSYFRKIRNFISRRSYLYKKIKQAKFKFDNYRGVKPVSPDGIIITGHNFKNFNITFLDDHKISNTRLASEEESKPYRELFRELLITTKNTFKKSKIYIVQQQDPRCLITNQKVFTRTKHVSIDNHCSALASIYNAQDQTIHKLEKHDIKIMKMYTDNPIPDTSFYDDIHTNSKGNIYIGKYILNKL